MRDTDEQVAAIFAGRSPGRTGWARANCPFCVVSYGKEDRTHALALNTKTGRWHCFRCNERGRVREELLGCIHHVEEAPRPDVVSPPDGFLPLAEEPAASATCLQPVRDYLDGRGVARSVWAEAGIGTCVRGLYAMRVVVPVRRPSGEWVGWISRSIATNPRKRYRNSSGAMPGIFNEAALYVETEEPCIVVEGVFDALPFWPDAVALLGKSYGQRLDMLLAARRPLAVVLDGDAWIEGEALAMRLQFDGKRAGFVRLPPLMDPDDCRDTLRDQARKCLLGGDAYVVGR